MKKKRWILFAACVLVAAGVAVVAVRPIRWRVHLAALKASGQIQDVSWGEMAHLMARGGGLDSGVILKTKDPYSAISAPQASPERVRAGRELFNQQCAPVSRRGRQGRNGPGPD